MDITRQSQRAAEAHETFLFTGEKTCISCHKGIAHQLPDMHGQPMFDPASGPAPQEGAADPALIEDYLNSLPQKG